MKPCITPDINQTQLKEVTQLLAETFSLKIKHAWLFSRQKEKVADFLRRSINTNNGIYVLNGERVMAFAGINRKGRPFIECRLKTFITCFGLTGGMWRCAMNTILGWMNKSLQADEMAIDAIAVSDEARGQGLGTLLLDKIFEIAHHEGKQAVLLEVVDTNPKAQALYEKKGFTVTHIEQLGRLTAKADFSTVMHMCKKLEKPPVSALETLK